MKRVKVSISLEELTGMQNRIRFLEKRLAVYEPPEPQLRLVDEKGKPTGRSHYPLRKPGPKSILDEMPDTFSRENVEQKGGNARMCILWKWRGYVTQSEDGQYHKSEGYKRRMYQAELRRIDDDVIFEQLNKENNNESKSKSK